MSGETDPGPTTVKKPPVTLEVSEEQTDSLSFSPIEMFRACADPGRLQCVAG